MAFCFAWVGDWSEVKRCVEDLNSTARSFEISLEGPLECLTLYLTGVYHQGVGELDAALQIFQGKMFNLSDTKSSNTSSAAQVERDLALLAALNTVWILQDGPRQDLNKNAAMIDRLRPFCENHPNKDIETAFNLIVASVTTSPPAPLFKVK